MSALSDIFDPVYCRSEIAEIERLSPVPLMEKAGLAVAEFVRERIGGGRVLVLAGPGNNGGDAFVAARHLKTWWFDVTLVFCGDESKLPEDAARACRGWLDAGGSCHAGIPGNGRWDLAIDGLFGIGLNRPIEGPLLGVIDALNALKIPMVSIDVPSGIASDTGRVLGGAVIAAHTLTFIGYKPGLLTSDGLDHCGEVRLDRLGLDVSTLKAPAGWRANREILKIAFKPRPRNSHKGLFGSTAVIGGSPGMVGAAILAARAALKLGSGKVILGANFALDFHQPEIMVREAQGAISENPSCIVVGPGLGKSEEAKMLVERALHSESTLVIDADALNLIAEDSKLQQLLASRRGGDVLTPHPGEASRLLGCGTLQIQEDRIAAAQAIVQRFGCAAVLKGAGSVCAFPGGSWAINPSGNPGLAQAGMGDVLSGMVGAFLSQGLDARDALLSAVYLHGAAAEILAEASCGPIGSTASELIDSARLLLNRIRTEE